MLPRSSWGTLLLAYKLVLGVGRPVFVRLMKWPFLAMLAGMVCQVMVITAGEPGPDGGIELPPLGQALSLLVQMASGIVVLAGMTAWARWVVDPNQPARFQWQRSEWVTLGRLVQVYFLGLLAGLAAAAAVFFALNLLLPSTPLQPGDGSIYPFVLADFGAAAVLPFLAMMAAVLAVWIRYCLSPVAAAVGAPSDLGLAAQAGRAGRWHMFWSAVLFVPTSLAAMLPLVVVGLMIVTVLASVASSPLMASVWGNILLSVLYIPIGLGLYGVFVAVFCVYYRWLVVKDLSH